jgi:Zn-dependent protease with chaperone function
MNRLLAPAIAALLLSLSACAKPQTAFPHATPAEVSAEAELHQQYLRMQRAKGLVIGGKNKKSARPRLEAVTARIAPAAINLCRDMGLPDPQGCAYSVHMKRGAEDKPNAYTDGRDVYINTPMIRHAATDDELALVMAHEFSHIIMNHHAGIQQNMIMGAVLGAAVDAALGANNNGAGLGAQAAGESYSPSYEREADYVALYITARAGYDYAKSIDFWRRISLTLPDSIYFSSTHPTNPERYVVLKKAVAEINTKQKNHMALIPSLRKDMAANNETGGRT